MLWMYLLIYASVIVGAVLALAWWAIWGRKARLPRGTAGMLTMIAGALLVLGVIAEKSLGTPLVLWLEVPFEFWSWYSDFRFTTPLVLGILGLVLLAFPIRARAGSGTADLTPRTPFSFTRKQWFVAPAVTLFLVLVATILAGAASQRDQETGHYDMYFVDVGEGMAMGTNIYGWYNSVPCLILLGLMGVLVAVDLALISRPALGDDRELDARIRTIRARNVLTVATGALVLHLAVILGSLAGTASIRSSFSTGHGIVSFWTTFAALEPVLRGASVVVATLGLALWFAVILSAVPFRRARTLVES